MEGIRLKSRPTNVAREALLSEIGQQRKKPEREIMQFASGAKDQRWPVSVVRTITLGRVLH